MLNHGTTRPRVVRFAEAPELASIDILEATATVVRDAIFSRHPSLNDFLQRPSKEEFASLVARLLVDRLDEIAGLVDWYRTAIRMEHEDDEDIPF
jgi:hypothetical protein